MAVTDIPCPFCGETIKSTAKKCKHCGEFLEPGLTARGSFSKSAPRKRPLNRPRLPRRLRLLCKSQPLCLLLRLRQPQLWRLQFPPRLLQLLLHRRQPRPPRQPLRLLQPQL